MMRVGKLASDNLRLGNGVSPIFQPRQVSLRQVYIDPPPLRKKGSSIDIFEKKT